MLPIIAALSYTETPLNCFTSRPGFFRSCILHFLFLLGGFPGRIVRVLLLVSGGVLMVDDLLPNNESRDYPGYSVHFISFRGREKDGRTVRFPALFADRRVATDAFRQTGAQQPRSGVAVSYTDVRHSPISAAGARPLASKRSQ